MTCSPGSDLLNNLQFLGFISGPSGEDSVYVVESLFLQSLL